MTLLSASYYERTLALIRAVAQGFRELGGEWPIWQYVDLRLAEQGVDGEQAYLGLPSWEYRYRPIWSGSVYATVGGNAWSSRVRGNVTRRS